MTVAEATVRRWSHVDPAYDSVPHLPSFPRVGVVLGNRSRDTRELALKQRVATFTCRRYSLGPICMPSPMQIPHPSQAPTVTIHLLQPTGLERAPSASSSSSAALCTVRDELAGQLHEDAAKADRRWEA